MERIIDRGDLHKYRTEIPNCVDDMGLSVYAFRLYTHLKHVAGDNGKSWQSTKTLVDACKMGAGSVSRAKAELCDAGLITIIKGDTKKSESDTIYIVDIWQKNFEQYAPSQEEAPHSKEEHPIPTGNPRSNSFKDNYFKNTSTELWFKTPSELHLQVRLSKQYQSKGRKFSGKWSNVTQRDRFRALEDDRGKDWLCHAVDTAMTKGIASLDKIVNFASTMNENHPKEKQRVYREDW